MEMIHSQIIAFTEHQRISLLEKTFHLTGIEAINGILTEAVRIDIIFTHKTQINRHSSIFRNNKINL